MSAKQANPDEPERFDSFITAIPDAMYMAPLTTLVDIYKTAHEAAQFNLEKAELHVLSANSLGSVPNMPSGGSFDQLYGIPVKLNGAVPEGEVWLVYPERLAKLRPRSIIRLKTLPEVAPAPSPR